MINTFLTLLMLSSDGSISQPSENPDTACTEHIAIDQATISIAPSSCVKLINGSDQLLPLAYLKQGQRLDVRDQRSRPPFEWRFGISTFVLGDKPLTIANLSNTGTSLTFTTISLSAAQALTNTKTDSDTYIKALAAADSLTKLFDEQEIQLLKVWIASGFRNANEMERLLDVVNTSSDTLFNARVTHAKASLDNIRGNNQAALKRYQLCATLFAPFNTAAAGHCLLNKGVALMRIPSERDNVINLLLEAEAMIDSAEQNTFKASLAANLGNTYKRLGELTKADEQLQRALTLHRKSGMRLGVSIALNNLGVFYRDFGSPQLAISYYMQALAHLATYPNDDVLARSKFGLAKTYFNNGEPDSALPFANQAARHFETLGSMYSLRATLILLGNIYQSLGQASLASASLERALALQPQPELAIEIELVNHLITPKTNEQLKDIAERLTSVNNRSQLLGLAHFYIAENYEQQLDRAAAMKHYDLALNYSESDNTYFGLPLTIKQREIALTRSNKDKLEATEQLLLKSYPKLWQLKSPTLKLSLLEKHRSLIDQAIESAIAINDPSKALLIDEASSAIDYKYNQQISSVEMTKDQQKLVDSLNHIHQAALPISTQNTMATQQTLISERIAMHEPASTPSRPMTKQQLSELQGRISDDDIIVVYRSMGSYIAQWLVTQNDVTYKQLEIKDRYDANSLGLSNISQTRLWIVADTLLRQQSFAALPLPSLQPLITKHEIAYLPALNDSPLLATTAKTSITLFGDPRYLANDTQTAPLVNARHELDRIANMASNSRIPIADFRQSNATVTQLINIPKTDILHIAAHSQADATSALASGLQLAKIDNNGNKIANFLTTSHVRTMHNHAALTVLSSCAAADGYHRDSSETVSVARAFLAMGSDRVISARKQVGDQSSVQLFTYFYYFLLNKQQPPITALANAQREMLKSGKWKKLDHWQHWVLQQKQID